MGFSTTILAIAVCLGLVHVLAGKLRFLDRIPRSRWLSFSGGVAVTYVFLHLLPELKTLQESLLDFTHHHGLDMIEHHAFLIALVGLVFFYGIERSTKQSRKEEHAATGADIPSSKMFWISIGSFGLYNAAIGYLLVSREQSGYAGLFLFALAVALHFIINDVGLRAHHKHLYHRYGRWLLCAAIIFGAVIGQFAEISEVALAVMISFLVGGIVLNVLKEELPDERESRFSAFAAGVVIYSILLLAV